MTLPVAMVVFAPAITWIAIVARWVCQDIRDDRRERSKIDT